MGLHSYMVVYIIFWLLVIYFNYRQIKFAQTLPEKKERNLIFWLQLILFIGVLLRTVYLTYPYGVYADEAINAYDSWCIANYGVDQHLNSYPVYFKSAGTGQTVLYAYLAAPFIKLFGISVPVHRMPMAIISSITMIFFYWTLRRTQKNILLTFIITAFLAINPWHIMKSRWGLDCNICPDMILIGTCFFALGYFSLKENYRWICYIAGSCFLVISAYGYGVSWLMLPLFVIGLFVLLQKHKMMTVKQCLACFGTIALIIFPLVLFAINLFFDGAQYNLGPLTITELDKGRHTLTTVSGNGNVLAYLTNSLKSSMWMFVWGVDGSASNSLRFWGVFYNLFGLLFIAYNIYYAFKHRIFDFLDKVFAIWLLSTILILIIVEPSVQHWNLLWFPLIYFCAKGIYFFVTDFLKTRVLVFTLFAICFVLFSYEYFNFLWPHQKGKLWQYSGLVADADEPILFVKQLNLDNVYYLDTKYDPIGYYITAYYNPVSPYEINQNKKQVGITVLQYSNNHFLYKGPIEPMRKTAYVILNDDIDSVRTDGFNIKKFKQYTVLWNE